MRLISWNVANRVKKQPRQLEAVLACDPDLLALQEVSEKTAGIWRKGLQNAGYDQIVISFDICLEPYAMVGGRGRAVLIASRFSLDVLDQDGLEMPWPERMVSVLVHHPEMDFELHAAYIPPGSSNGWIKIETFEGIYDFLAVESSCPRILCGDFNSPQLELEDGRTVLWGQKLKASGEIVNTNKPRWPEGERSVIRGLADYDLPDIYRLLNGYEAEDYSWIVKRKGEVVSRRRFDHIFASPSLNPVSCRYLHHLRTRGLSDHSAVEAVFLPGERTSQGEHFLEWAERNVLPFRSREVLTSRDRFMENQSVHIDNMEQGTMNTKRDDIRDLDPGVTHRAAFLSGWTRAVQGELYATATEKKTHANMGNLFGWIYGEQSQEFKLATWYRYLENAVSKSKGKYDWDYYARNHGTTALRQFRIAVGWLKLLAEKHQWDLKVDFTKVYVGFKLDRINIFAVNWLSKDSWAVAFRIKNIKNKVRTFDHWEFSRLENKDGTALYKSKDNYIPVMEELESFYIEVFEKEKKSPRE